MHSPSRSKHYLYWRRRVFCVATFRRVYCCSCSVLPLHGEWLLLSRIIWRIILQDCNKSFTLSAAIVCFNTVQCSLLIFNLMFYAFATISRRRYSVFGLSVRPSVRDHVLIVCAHDILQTVCANLTKFTSTTRGQKNLYDFEVERSKMKVTARSNGPFSIFAHLSACWAGRINPTVTIT